jgi:hypothetical protein
MSTATSNEELAGRIAMALGLFSSCIKSGEDWSPQCEQALRDAFDALRQLGERLQNTAKLPPIPNEAVVDAICAGVVALGV